MVYFNESGGICVCIETLIPVTFAYPSQMTREPYMISSWELNMNSRQSAFKITIKPRASFRRDGLVVNTQRRMHLDRKQVQK